MANYLIRGGKTPTEQLSVEHYVNRNITGTNSGNFLYLYSIVRTLMTDESVTFESTQYKFDYTKAELKKFSERYDGFIIPLADAFRPDFLNELEGLTRMIKEMTIPCYVIGVGMGKGFESLSSDEKDKFKAKVKEFVSAAVESSSIIGVRGKSTGAFLKQLGFVEGKDFSVIGCPSMYTFGSHLKIRDTEKNADTPAAYNLTYFSRPETTVFLQNAAKEFKDIIFVPQLIAELKTLYWGTNYRNPHPNDLRSAYPCNINSDVYAENRVRYFVNVNDWLDFMKTRDLAFGTRLHGNIAAILADTPSLLITKDLRTRELAEFHGLCSIDEADLDNYNNIWDLINSADFHSPESKHMQNFENFLDFLHANGLKTIYDDDMYRTDAPLDDIIKAARIHNEIKPAVLCDKKEIISRLNKSIKFAKKDRDDYKKDVSRLETELEKQTEKAQQIEQNNKTAQLELKNRLSQTEKQLSQTEKQLDGAKDKLERAERILNCRPVKMAVGLRNIFFPKNKKIKL